MISNNDIKGESACSRYTSRFVKEIQKNPIWLNAERFNDKAIK